MTVIEAPARPKIETPANVFETKITEVKHYTDRLFHFRCSRPASLRFRSGEFIMIGLPPTEGRPVFRAYSIASPAWEEELEFFSIKVEDGPLTSKLALIQSGDTLWVKKKPTGTLVLDALRPGKTLYMISTGTGFAPFASLIRDPETYEKFDTVVVTHTCRQKDELSYGFEQIALAKDDPLVGEIAREKLRHFTSTTREESQVMGRITHLMSTGVLYNTLNLPPLNPETDRVMICGSNDMIQDVKDICVTGGLVEGSNASPADFVIEKAFVG